MENENNGQAPDKLPMQGNFWRGFRNGVLFSLLYWAVILWFIFG